MAPKRERQSGRGGGLFRAATQTVFGEGAVKARVMLVGETPTARTSLALHPSALLRIRDAGARRRAFERFVADLALVHTARRSTSP